MEFHISRQARKRYQFEESLFSFNGSVIFANFHSARVFAQRMNEKREVSAPSAPALRAGHVNAMGLIDEILHLVIWLYRAQMTAAFYQNIESHLIGRLGVRKLNSILRAFTRDFPPPAVYQKQQTATEYLRDEVDGIANRSTSIEEILMLWLVNQNEAYQPYAELFNDQALLEKTAYREMIVALEDYFRSQPGFGPDNQDLISMLRSPAIAEPSSLRGQLEYIRTRWADLLGHHLLKLLGSLDLFSEEERVRGLGPGPVQVPVFGAGLAHEYERFSPDADWMPNLVLMAKNAFVWLHQLDKQYGKNITRLDMIPDEELDRLAEWGFSGLWLIGLWERSRASARIKQICGNPEAIASAYSLKEYRIAEELGGEEALENLKHRCGARGIRLASDMVPNHMAIDSGWVVDHPDWFVSLPHSPFPSYTFSGPDLGDREDIDIRIEDHYYDCSDAAVVFQHTDRRTNRTRYIYHGNDGTSMPWNDTAQLNYLDPNVREAVIRVILDVARRFPIIRFDAAMTLAKRHYQRLWYPLPGGGCDIPSRSEFGLPQTVFDQRMPEEFWREVVDRVAAEAPDTLLLAEAFWLMEGYFVRTLGMHRVYNSAFMNLLRDEDNAKYRQVMKNTLEFDPQILKRYVNFMNNPDEQTAANQFGNGDKYFGICTLMATMPGLPMFGHGQVEALKEKYGMEYKRAYWDEQPDEQVVERHIRQIFPLLRHRHLFSDVEHFYLYDFFTQEGVVDENIFAYSNRAGDERSLVIYHNRFGSASGWVRSSAGFMDKESGQTRQMDLLGGLALPNKKDTYVIFRDHLNGLDYIRYCPEIAKKGLFISLDAYRAHVFLDFRIVEDDDKGLWQRVYEHLDGRGATDIQALLVELPLRPILQPLREIANPAYFQFLLDQRPRAYGEGPPEFLLNEASHKMMNLIEGASALLGQPLKGMAPCGKFRRKMSILFQAQWVDQSAAPGQSGPLGEMAKFLRENSITDDWLAQVCWLYLDCLRGALGKDTEQFLRVCRAWRILPALDFGLRDFEPQGGSSDLTLRAILFLLKAGGWFKNSNRRPMAAWMEDFLADDFIQAFLKFNKFDGRIWFGREEFERALGLLAYEGIYEILAVNNPATRRAGDRLGALSGRIMSLKKAAQTADYAVDKFFQAIR